MNEIYKKSGLVILTLIALGIISYMMMNGMADTPGLAGEESGTETPVVTLKSYGNFSQEDYNIYEVMPEAINMSQSEMSPYMTLEGGPLVGYGLYYKGYIEIWWNEDVEVNEDTMDRIYAVWNKNGKKVGIDNIPVVFTRSSKFEGD